MWDTWDSVLLFRFSISICLIIQKGKGGFKGKSCCLLIALEHFKVRCQTNVDTNHRLELFCSKILGKKRNLPGDFFFFFHPSFYEIFKTLFFFFHSNIKTVMCVYPLIKEGSKSFLSLRSQKPCDF